MAQKPMARKPMAHKPVAQQPTARKPGVHTPMVREPASPPPAAAQPGTPLPRAHLEFQPVVHVSDMAASVAFYERLGGEIVHGRRDDDWVLLQLGTVQLSLIAGSPLPPGDHGPVELNFGVATPIEQLQNVLPGARVDIDRTFGRRLLVRSPDGLLIRINQREPDVT